MNREYFYSVVVLRKDGIEDRLCGVWVCSKETSHKDVLNQIVEGVNSEKNGLVFIAFNALPIRD